MSARHAPGKTQTAAPLLLGREWDPNTETQRVVNTTITVAQGPIKEWKTLLLKYTMEGSAPHPHHVLRPNALQRPVPCATYMRWDEEADPTLPGSQKRENTGERPKKEQQME